MQYQSRRPRRRRSRRTQQYEGRSYAAPAGGCPVEPAPSRAAQAAEDALSTVVDLFESGDLPARIAETVIARAEGTSPMASWSLGNQLLALMAGTSDARGFRQWKDAGRSVRKGARAFYILGPVKRKIRDRDAETGEDTERTIVAGFKGIPVFRYEDTDGHPVERPDYTPATFPPLFDVAARLGVTVEYAPFVDRFRGYYSPGADRIVLCSHDEGVFFHELAHAAHRHVLRARGADLCGGQHAGQEIVAEVVAATLARLFDLDPGHLTVSAEYVSHYAKGGNPGKAALRVLSDVQAVLTLIIEGELPAAAKAA